MSKADELRYYCRRCVTTARVARRKSRLMPTAGHGEWTDLECVCCTLVLATVEESAASEPEQVDALAALRDYATEQAALHDSRVSGAFNRCDALIAIAYRDLADRLDGATAAPREGRAAGADRLAALLERALPMLAVAGACSCKRIGFTRHAPDCRYVASLVLCREIRACLDAAGRAPADEAAGEEDDDG